MERFYGNSTETTAEVYKVNLHNLCILDWAFTQFYWMESIQCSCEGLSDYHTVIESIQKATKTWKFRLKSIKILASFEMRESEDNPKFDHCEARFTQCNLTGKASSLQNHIKGRPTKLLIMYEAFLHAIWAPCVWHECVCCMCVSVSELNGGVRRGMRRARRLACGVRGACGVRQR